MDKLTDPLDPRITESVKARFWSKVDRRGDGECWPWKGANVGKLGYGRAFLDDMARVYAHRLSLLIDGRAFTDDAPDALHSCDNPVCVNPAHLRAGHKLANAKDMVERGRALTGDRAPFRAKPEACPRGEGHSNHVLTEQEVREIREAYVPFVVTQAELGLAYGVNPGQIGKIVRKQDWKHVTDEPPSLPPPPPPPAPKKKMTPKFSARWKRSFDGSRKPNQPLEEHEIARIKELVRNGFEMKQVAGWFHVHPDTVSRILKKNNLTPRG